MEPLDRAPRGKMERKLAMSEPRARSIWTRGWNHGSGRQCARLGDRSSQELPPVSPPESQRCRRTPCAPTRATCRSFSTHVAARAGVKRRDLEPAALDRAAIRGFLADAHAHGQSRATAARKLAAVRTFLRYLRREGVIDDDPGALIATPKRDVRMPAHLSEQEMIALLAAPAGDEPLGRRDQRDSRAVLRVGTAAERARRPGSRRCEPEREDGARAREGRQAAAGAVQREHRRRRFERTYGTERC